MYLSDIDIRDVLGEMDIVCDDPQSPFDADAQIQPCSVDIRLSNVFWVPKHEVKGIDLRRTALLELDPRRYWKKRVLAPNASITLESGDMLLGRTCELFTIPRTCAGKIEGRSSFARMGLAVHCTGDFINPGYRGHMPLQLVNHSAVPIKVFPFLPICQLVLVKLSSAPTHVYGEKEIQSTYMNDDGGPSYWWRDKRFQDLIHVLAQYNVDTAVQEAILHQVGVQEPEVVKRFENYLGRAKPSARENADALLEAFAQSETRQMRRSKIRRALALLLLPVMIGIIVKLVLSQAPATALWVAGASCLLALMLFVWGTLTEVPEFLTTKRLRTIESRGD